MKKELEPELVERLVDGRLSSSGIRAFIEEWIDDELENADYDEDEG